MRIYLDSCALSRPYDEYLNNEIAQDAGIIENIFCLVDLGSLILVDSEVLDIETQAIEDEEISSFLTFVMYQENYHIELMKKAISRLDSK